MVLDDVAHRTGLFLVTRPLPDPDRLRDVVDRRFTSSPRTQHNTHSGAGAAVLRAGHADRPAPLRCEPGIVLAGDILTAVVAEYSGMP